MRHLRLWFCLLASACSLGLEREPPQQARFLLDARRPGEPAPPASTGVLEVGAFHAASAFGTARFVYRTLDDRYETDYYREFLVAPASSIADAARAWLADSGVAAAVVDPGSRTPPTHAVEADLTELYGDFRVAGEPRAVLALRAAVVDRASGGVLVQASYAESEPLASATPDELPAAWRRALTRILARLEQDVRRALGS